MQSLRSSRTWFSCYAVIAIALLAGNAQANNGREFSGYFDLSHIQEQGDLVQVTLHLKLFNHGDSDARSVIIALMDSSPALSVRGNFQPVKVWKAGHFIEISQQFSIPKYEFNEWMQAPVQPNLLIFFQDAKGKTLQRGAQVSRRPWVRVAEEGQ